MCALYSAPASAQLAVDRLWVDFEPGAPNRADVVIRNESADRYYITVAPSEVVEPGTAGEKRVETSDPDQLGILVTPNRMIVEPGGMRSIRIVSLNTKLKTDRVYRIKVTPQIGDLQTNDPAAGDRGLSIKLLAAYDLLVTVRPDGGKADLVAARTPTQLVIRNQGNSNALLYDGMSCAADQPADKDKCAKVGSKRLYPGNEWTIPLNNQNAKIKFKERTIASAPPKDLAF